MEENQALAQIRDILADLYDDLERIRIITHDVGLDESKIRFSGPIQNCWHSALREAAKQRKVKNIVRRALYDYQDHSQLIEAWFLYQQALSKQSTGQTVNTPKQSKSQIVRDQVFVALYSAVLAPLGSQFIVVQLWLMSQLVWAFIVLVAILFSPNSNANFLSTIVALLIPSWICLFYFFRVYSQLENSVKSSGFYGLNLESRKAVRTELMKIRAKVKPNKIISLDDFLDDFVNRHLYDRYIKFFVEQLLPSTRRRK